MANYDIDNMEIGLRIKSLRENYGYTQDELAEKAQLSTAFISDIEVGKKGISANTLMKLSTALNVSADFVLFGKCVESSWIQHALANMSNQDADAVEQLLISALKIVQQKPEE